MQNIYMFLKVLILLNIFTTVAKSQKLETVSLNVVEMSQESRYMEAAVFLGMFYLIAFEHESSFVGDSIILKGTVLYEVKPVSNVKIGIIIEDVEEHSWLCNLFCKRKRFKHFEFVEWIGFTENGDFEISVNKNVKFLLFDAIDLDRLAVLNLNILDN